MRIHREGLKPLPKDTRDYSYHKTFGGALNYTLPLEFQVAAPLVIKDQGQSDECTAFASSEVAEDEDGVEFCPQWFFAKEKQLLGSYQGYGADLRTACRVACSKGFLPQSEVKMMPSPIDLTNRDQVANWQNWPPGLDLLAAKYKKGNYFAVENFYNDIFDSIRVTLYANRMNKQSILAGSKWYLEWNTAPGGVIPSNASIPSGMHAFKIFGWKMIGTEPYLIVQNSLGSEFGDQGLNYFPRSVVNQEFTEGLFCFVEPGTEPVQTVDASLLQQIINFFARLLRSWAH